MALIRNVAYISYIRALEQYSIIDATYLLVIRYRLYSAKTGVRSMYRTVKSSQTMHVFWCVFQHTVPRAVT